MVRAAGRSRKPTQRLLASLHSDPKANAAKAAEAVPREPSEAPPAATEAPALQPDAPLKPGSGAIGVPGSFPEVPASAVSEPAGGFFMEEGRGKCLMFVLAQALKDERSKGAAASQEDAPEQATVGLLEKRRDARKPDIWVLCEGGSSGTEGWQLKKLPTDNFGPWAEAVMGRPHGTMDWKKSTDIRYMLGWPKKRNGDRFKSIEAWPDPSFANNSQAFAVALGNVIQALQSDKWTLDAATCPSRYLFTSGLVADKEPQKGETEEAGAPKQEQPKGSRSGRGSVAPPVATVKEKEEEKEEGKEEGKEEEEETPTRVTRSSKRLRLSMDEDPHGHHSSGFADAASTLLEIAAMHHAAMQGLGAQGNGNEPEPEQPPVASNKALPQEVNKREQQKQPIEGDGPLGGLSASAWALKGRRTTQARRRAVAGGTGAQEEQEVVAPAAKKQKLEEKPGIDSQPPPEKRIRIKVPGDKGTPPPLQSLKSSSSKGSAKPGSPPPAAAAPSQRSSIVVKKISPAHNGGTAGQQQGGQSSQGAKSRAQQQKEKQEKEKQQKEKEQKEKQQQEKEQKEKQEKEKQQKEKEKQQKEKEQKEMQMQKTAATAAAAASKPISSGAGVQPEQPRPQQQPGQFEPLSDCPGLTVDHGFEDLRQRWSEKDGARAITAWLGDVASRVLPEDTSDPQPRREHAAFRMLMAKVRRKVVELDEEADEEAMEAVSQCLELAHDYNTSRGHEDAALALTEVLRDISRLFTPRCQR